MTLLDFFREHDVPFLTEGNHHCRPGWVQTDCPFCGRDTKKFHLGFSLRGRYAHCWKCGSHGLFATLQELTGLPYGRIRAAVGDDDPDAEPAAEKPQTGRLLLPPGIGPLLPAHRRYLKSRHFDPDTIAECWGVRGIGISIRKFSWRLFIPFTYRGRIVSWTTRGITDREPRYVSAHSTEEALPAKSLLYGEDFARNTVIVFEGPTDVWAVGPGAVSIGGLGYSTRQLNRIARYPVRYICFDSEPDAQARAEKLCEALEALPGKTCRIQLDAPDPGSARPHEINQLRKLFR